MTLCKIGPVGSRRRGAVIPAVAVMMAIILGLAALSVDAGNMYRVRRNTQTAADAAADAAAIELLSKYSVNRGVDVDGQARQAAISFATANGFPESDITVNIPPLSGNYIGKRGYAEVLIKSNPPRFFSRVFSSNALEVSSRAVGAGTLIPTKASVLVLDPKGKNSLTLKASSSSLEVGGDVFVNSKHKNAANVDKKAQLKAEHVLVSGGLKKKSIRNIDAEVKTGVNPTPDPFESLPAPPKGSTLDANDFKTSIGRSDTYNLLPGTYKELKFGNDDTVNMAPGIYYVDGGGFELKGTSTLQAADVMIYNTGKRGFKVSTKGNVSISPPKSGVYKGMTLFQDSQKKTKVEFSRQNHLDISGIVYAPNSEVKFRKSDVDLGSGDDDDWELEEDVAMEQDSGSSELETISASIVARKLSIDKRTSVTVMGTDIAAYRPLLGVVE